MTTTVEASGGLVLVSGGNILASSSIGGSLTNGNSFTVTGSFDTKSSIFTVYDDCQGTNIGTKWNNIRPFYTPATGDGWTETYRLPTDLTPNSDAWSQTGANLIGAATPFRSKYICSALMSQSVGGYGAANLMFGQHISSITLPAFIVGSWYEAYSPNWLFNTPYSGGAPGDNNFKWLGYSASTTTFPATGGQNWYMEDGNSEFTGPTTTPTYDVNSDTGTSNGATGRKLPPNQGQSFHGPNIPSKFYNGCNGWIKKEVIMRLASDTSGWIQAYVSQPTNGTRFNAYLWNNVNGTGTTDGYTNTPRAFWIGGFRRDFPQAQNRQYWSDVYVDWQGSTGGVGRFAITDTNSLTTATVIEYQPYTSWASNSVTLTCQKGNLSTGTVYLWYLDEVNGNQSLGAYTMN